MPTACLQSRTYHRMATIANLPQHAYHSMPTTGVKSESHAVAPRSFAFFVTRSGAPASRTRQASPTRARRQASPTRARRHRWTSCGPRPRWLKLGRTAVRASWRGRRRSRNLVHAACPGASRRVAPKHTCRGIAFARCITMPWPWSGKAGRIGFVTRWADCTCVCARVLW